MNYKVVLITTVQKSDSVTHTHRHTDTQTYTHTHTYTHVHTYTYIHTHTHTHIFLFGFILIGHHNFLRILVKYFQKNGAGVYIFQDM